MVKNDLAWVSALKCQKQTKNASRTTLQLHHARYDSKKHLIIYKRQGYKRRQRWPFYKLKTMVRQNSQNWPILGLNFKELKKADENQQYRTILVSRYLCRTAGKTVPDCNQSNDWNDTENKFHTTLQLEQKRFINMSH